MVVRGRVNHRDDGITLQAITLQQPDFGVSAETGHLTLTVREQRATVEVVSELDTVLSAIAALPDAALRHRDHYEADAGRAIFGTKAA